MNLTKRGDYYNNHRQDKIRRKTVHVRKTRSPATPSTHDPPNSKLISEINTTQEPRGTPAKTIADTIRTPPRRASPQPPPDTSPHSHPSKPRPLPDPPSLVSGLHVTQTTTIAPGNQPSSRPTMCCSIHCKPTSSTTTMTRTMGKL